MPAHATEDLTAREVARIVKSVVSPRPIAWISTRNEDGVDNLAPFSSYNYVGSEPPVLLFTSSMHDGEPKHSAQNAVARGEFAVNVVTEEHLETMDHTSESIPRDESEFDLAGVERAPCATIDAARVAEAVVTMECTLHDTLDIHGRLGVMGDVRYVHVDDSVLVDGKVDAREVHTVGRLGGPYYTVSEPVAFERQY